MTKRKSTDRGPSASASRLGRRGLLGLAAVLGAGACSPGSGSGSAAGPGAGTPSAPPTVDATSRPVPAGTPSPTETPAATETPTATTATPTAATATPAPGQPAVEVGNGPRTGNAIALTFHGAGDGALARELLALVDRAGVTVTVLAVGTWLQQQPATARAFLASGHELGNHTMNHLEMKQLSAATAEREIEGCRAELEKVTGSPQRWFRASGTQHTTARIRAAAGRAGYQRCLSYDVDGLDWQDPSAATVTAAVLDGATAGSVVSLHLGHRVTVEALPAILTGLRRKRLTAVGVSQLLA